MAACVRECQQGDAQQLAPMLREADRQELLAATGLDPLTVLERSVEGSLIACSIVRCSDSHVVGMFGAVVSPEWDKAGIVWLVGADALVKPPILRQFIRESRAYCVAFHSRFSLLIACADERNTTHLCWLKRLGFFVFARHERFGAWQRPFIELVRIKGNV